MPGASLSRKVAAVEPTIPSASPGAASAEDAFFSGAHEPVYVDEYAFEEGEQRDNKPVIIAVVGLVAALALIFGLGSLEGPQGVPAADTPPTAAAETAPSEPEVAAAEVAEVEGSADGSGADALAAAEARAEAIRNDMTSKSMQLAEGIAYVAEEVAESSTRTPLAPITPRATAPAVAATPRAARPSTADTAPAPREAAGPAGDAESALRACANAYTAGNYATTLEACETAARLNPRSSDVYTYLGTANYELGNDGQAQNQLERAVQLNQRNITALVTLGAVRQSAGDLDGAREVYERYLQVNPNGRQAPEIRRILEQGL
jgi:tetratricopeptide (TPR) repeat protein